MLELFSALIFMFAQTGSINKTCTEGFQCWVCDAPVALTSVDINIPTNTKRVDAVKFAPGCTGTIESLNIVTRSADGVKIAEGAHNISVNSGSIECTDKVPDVHQDGIQAMGGNTITFRKMKINCGRQNATLIDSNVFINGTTPTDVIVANSWLGPFAAHTVNLEKSVRSGVRNSTICLAKYPRLTFTIGAEAINPVNRDNTFPGVC